MTNVAQTLRQKGRQVIVKAVVEQFGDGKWHAVETIAERVGTTVDRVSSALSRANKRSNARARSESKRVGKSFHIRIFEKEKSVSADELATKLKPIIDGLKAEGRKSIVTMSPPTVAHLAHQLAKLLDEWTRDRPVQAHTGHGGYPPCQSRRKDDV